MGLGCLILDGVEDFVDGELERIELLYQLVGSVRGLRALVSYRHATPCSDPRHGRRLHAETLTSLCGRQVSRSGWKKSSLPFLTGCKFELGTKSRASE